MTRWLAPSLVLPLIGCGMPDTPAPEAAARDGVLRRSYEVVGTLLRVSLLAKGDSNGRRVIFVHGTPGAADGWERFLAKPLPGVAMIAIDRPGFGATTPGDAVTSLRAQAAAIAPLLQERAGHWPILVGHSLGGPIVAQLALDNPGKVGALLILAGSFDPGLEEVYAVQYMGEWPGIRSMLPRALRNANRELIALEPELAALAPRLGDLRCPITLVHGTEDKQVPFANVAFVQARLTKARVKVRKLAGRDHFLPWKEQSLIEKELSGLLAAEPSGC